MDLNRKLLAGEKIFDQKFCIAAVRHLKPDFTDRLIAIHRIVECRPERSTPPWLFHPAHYQLGVGHHTPSLRYRGSRSYLRRSDERRVGKEWVSPVKYRWSP